MTQNEPRLLANPKLKREHGGNTESVASRFDLEPGCLLDFSANVNPRGLPPKAGDRLAREAQNIALLRQYPDWEASELCHVLSLKHGIAIDRLVIGAGASELIAASLRALQPRHCLCPIPAFSEYPFACQVSGCSFSPFPLDPARDFSLDVERVCQALRTGTYDLLILNNPHNPSGALLSSEPALEILTQAERTGTAVILDEAFIDYAPAASLTSKAARQAAVVAIRSVTKFYGCPALRVGYAVASSSLAARIAAQLPAWPVTTLALSAAAVAVTEHDYEKASIESNETERSKLGEALKALGFRVFPSATNFLLLQVPSGGPCSTEIWSRLIKEHHIQIRNCDSFEGLQRGLYLRVAVLGPAENDQLVRALQIVLER